MNEGVPTMNVSVHSIADEAIAALEAELAALDARRPKLVAGIATMRDLFSVRAPVIDPRASTQPKPAKRGKGKPEVPPRAVDHTPSRDIEGLIRRAGGTMTPRALAEAMGVNVHRMRYHLKPFLKAKRVIGSGATINRKLSLPGAVATPTTAPTSRNTAISAEAAAVGRDEAILARLKHGKATFDELLTVLPDTSLAGEERVQACKAALRRLTLKRKVADVGDKFQLQ